MLLAPTRIAAPPLLPGSTWFPTKVQFSTTEGPKPADMPPPPADETFPTKRHSLTWEVPQFKPPPYPHPRLLTNTHRSTMPRTLTAPPAPTPPTFDSKMQS